MGYDRQKFLSAVSYLNSAYSEIVSFLNSNSKVLPAINNERVTVGFTIIDIWNLNEQFNSIIENVEKAYNNINDLLSEMYNIATSLSIETGLFKFKEIDINLSADYNNLLINGSPLEYYNNFNDSSSKKRTIVIPSEYGNEGRFTYTGIYDMDWHPDFDPYKVLSVWKFKGEKSNDNIATIDGRYLIACTETYGKVGDKIDFYLGDGTKIETVMMDAKAQVVCDWDQNPANKWGHHDGQQVLEFEITSPLNDSGDVGSWMGWTGLRVASAENLGENILDDENYSEIIFSNTDKKEDTK